MTYEITTNTTFNSLEISFDSKPDEKIREALKSLKFRWHNVKKVWYGYADEQALRIALGEDTPAEAPAKSPKAKTNKYGVKVGDIFCASWGWEQTNVDFFQVIALVGEYSVRVREVNPEIIEEEAVSGMSAHYTYKLTSEILPPARSIFIEDQENGDVKRLKAGWGNTPEEAAQNCSFKLESYATATKCNGETVRKYVSWYA